MKTSTLRVLCVLIVFISGTVYAQQGWTAQTSNTSVDLQSIYFSDANNGTAVGGNPFTVLRTTDGGLNWFVQFTTSANFSLFDVYFSDTNNGIIVGYGGTVFRTTDGGANWDTVPIGGLTNTFWGLSFADASVGTAVGSIGRILRTEDGGLTWVNQPGAPQLGLNDVFMINTNSILAVGGGVGADDGLIMRSDDAGATWNSQNGNTADPIYDVAFSDANNGLVVGGGGVSNGLIHRTIDGGVNWAAVNPTSIPVLSGVELIDANNGVAVGLLGTILRTGDGGASWIAENSGTTAFLLKSFFLNGANGYVVGTDGTILHYQGPVGIGDSGEEVADGFELYQNYPNPFNPTTRIGYRLEKSSVVELAVYDLLGKRIKSLLSKTQAAGEHEATWDGRDIHGSVMPSGLYLYRLDTGNKVYTRQMLLMR